MKWFESIVAFVPAPVLAWATPWAGIWAGAGITHPHWATQTQNLGIALGVVLSLLTAFMIFISDGKYSYRSAIIGVCMVVLALSLCLILREYTIRAATPETTELGKLLWSISYALLIGFFIQFVGAVAATLLGYNRKRN